MWNIVFIRESLSKVKIHESLRSYSNSAVAVVKHDDCYNVNLTSENLLILVSVMGDNEISKEDLESLSSITSKLNHKKLFVRIALIGDVHSWDGELSKTTAYKQVSVLLRNNYNAEIYREKLSPDNICIAPHEYIDILTTTISDKSRSDKAIIRLNDLSNSSFTWDPDSHKIAFEDPVTGEGSFHKFGAPRDVFKLLSEANIKSLTIPRAYLYNMDLEGVEWPKGLLAINLPSNHLSEALFSRLPESLKWINLSANGLSAFDFNLIPTGVKSLMIYKNSIDQIAPLKVELKQLESVSIYRNMIEDASFFSELQSLKKINIGANPISHIPNEFSQLNNLEFLGLARTNITKIPDWVYNHPTIKTIDISHIDRNISDRDKAKLSESGIETITYRY